MNRILNINELRGALRTTGDSVKDRVRDKRGGSLTKDLDTLRRAENAWESHRKRRARRLRNIRYVWGDQWGDLIETKSGEWVTERELMRRKGQAPLQNNHLIKIVNTLSGLYAKSSTMPVCFARKKDADIKSQMMTNALQTNWERNEEKELLVERFVEMIVGGVSVVCEEWETRDGEEDSYTYPVNPSYFFWESKMGDPREWDASMVGEIRDYTLDELVAEIAESTLDHDALAKIYSPWLQGREGLSGTQATDKHKSWNMSWNMPSSNNLCRTYHVWTRESKLRYRVVDPIDMEQPLYRIDKEDLDTIKEMNKERVRLAIDAGVIAADTPAEEAKAKVGWIEYQPIYDQYWHFEMLSPWGDVLMEFDSPYDHKSHPYVWRSYHFVNGDIVPFISSVLDQQRYINRLIMMKDMMMMASAKGLRFIPSTMIPDDMSRDEFLKQCTEIGGTIFWKPDPKNPNAVPQFFTNNSQDAGFSELLAMEVGFINEITAVSEALQGKTPSSGTAASRYAMETENSTTAVASLIQKFSAFEHEVAVKKMKTIHQFYTEPRCISHKKSNGYSEYAMYEPKEVADIDFEVAVKDAPESQVARMMINDFVMQLWQSGVISALQALENSYIPGTEDLKQTLRAQLENVQNGGAPQQIPQSQVAQVQGAANPQAVQMLEGAMRA